MTSATSSSSLTAALRSASSHLRTDPAAVTLADHVAEFAAALHHPNGFVVKALGAGIRYDLCAATAAGADAAAQKAGMSPGSYTVEPFLILHP